ncbi:glycosyltransferase [bacterium]|nr:glycosyltransferase [bacterium]
MQVHTGESSQGATESSHALSIIIPALNEYPGIMEVLADLRQVISTSLMSNLYEHVQIIVVNDGSTDQTAEEVGRCSDVHLINFSRNRGYGAALKAGFAAAESGHLAFLDADGTYPPSELPRLCSTLCSTDADIVVGSRMSGALTGMPRVRYWGNRLFAALTSWAAGVHVQDCASGLRVFRKDTLSKIYPLPDGLNFTPAMTTRALHEGLKIVDVPITYHERVGASKLNAVRDGFKFLGSILRMTTHYNPLKFFGLLGFGLIALGFLYGLGPIYHYFRFQQVPEDSIYRLLAILTFCLGGLQILAFGILANFTLGVFHKVKHTKSKVMAFFSHKSWFNRLDIVGLFMVLCSFILNYGNVVEYLTRGTVSGHWSYVVVGALLTLSGLQLFTVQVLIRLLNEVRGREAEIAKDLGSER